MDRDELVALVVSELSAALPLEGLRLKETDVLLELPGIDSVKLARIATAVERASGAEFEDEALFGAKTVGDLADALVIVRRTAV